MTMTMDDELFALACVRVSLVFVPLFAVALFALLGVKAFGLISWPWWAVLLPWAPWIVLTWLLVAVIRAAM